VDASHRNLLKQGAHVLGVAGRERPTCVVGQKLRVATGDHTLTPHCIALISNGEQGDSGAIEDWQVALTELHEDLVCSPLQSVVADSCGTPSHHGQIRGVSRDVHMDLATSTPKLTVWVTTVCRSPRVAKVVQHVPEQGGKTGAVQPVATELSVGSQGGIGVVVHLFKTRKK
jgi:hypothetical protein